MEAPDLVAVPRVERPGSPRADLHAPEPPDPAASAGREIHEPGQHRRGARDRGRRAETPPHVARAGIQRDEVAVPGADEDRLPPDRSRRIDVRPDLPRPQQVPAPGSEGVDGPVRVPDEDPPVGDRRRRVEVLAPPEARERRRVPLHPPGARVDGVDASAARRHKDAVVRMGGGSHDLVVGRERPAQGRLALTLNRVRVQAVVPRSEVEGVADEERGRLDGSRLDPPQLAAVPRVPGDDEPARIARVLRAGKRVHEGLVDDPVVNRRRRGRTAREVPRPHDLPGPRVDRVEAPLLLGDVDLSVRDRRRELDVGPRLQLPQPVVRRP